MDTPYDSSSSHSLQLPLHLAQPQAQGIRESEPIAQFEIGNYKNFVYLILDWTSRKAAIVDPQLDLAPPLESLNRYGFELTQILITHSHFDHIAGVPALMKIFPEILIRVHPKDAHRMRQHPEILNRIQPVQEGDELQIGDLKIRVLHTPGHSAGECCYFLDGNPPYLFTGDTVFIRDCGRTDLEGGSNQEMFESLQKIRKLPENTVLLPGHHYQRECASSLRTEIWTSPPFLCQSMEELAQLP